MRVTFRARYQSYRRTLFRVYLIVHCFRVLYLLRATVIFSAKPKKKKFKRKETPEFVEATTTAASFFLRVERFTILRLRLKMKPVDRRNRFLGKDFFRRSRERARGVFSSRDNKNSPSATGWSARDSYLLFPKTCLDKNPVALLFASPRAGRRSSRRPLSSRAPLSELGD